MLKCNRLHFKLQTIIMELGGVLHDFSFISPSVRGRAFPGFADKTDLRSWQLAPRASIQLGLHDGDLVSIHGLQIDDQVVLLVIGDQGNLALDLLNLGNTATPLDPNTCNLDPIQGWANSLGLGAGITQSAASVSGTGDIVVLKAKGRGSVWIAYPVAALDTVNGHAPSALEVAHQPFESGVRELPEPLGSVRDEFTVKRGSAQAYEVHEGEIVQIIDIEGQQCSDFTAFRSADLASGIETIIDSTATRSMVRGAYPGPGLFDKFYDGELRPMLNVVQDTCGRHDAFGVACTARSYQERGFPGHVNCSDNISHAAAPFGVRRRNAWPAINFFWSTWIDPHNHSLLTEESWSRPGDYVAMRAMDNLVCVTTACPDDIDPINGWNPTDIHVRIYRPNAPVKRAVAYREKEDAPMAISRESAFHPRTSLLTSHFSPARDLWAPVSFPSTGTIGEYWACRERVTLQDMSGLRKYDIIGPDAEKLLQRTMTRNIAKLAVWRGTYSLICDETGAVVDDGTLFRLAPDLFRWCCGTEESARILKMIARDEGWHVRINTLGGSMPNLALQGPCSRELLQKVVFTQPHVPSLEQIKWFGVSIARLHDREGIPFMLARSGYTGELGYELFCTEDDATELWDALMHAGEEFGIEPMGGAALEIIRIEAGLAAPNAEFAPGVDAFEAGLGFAVDLNKSDFVGKDALTRNADKPRKILKGLLIDCDDVPPHGAQIFSGERPVGVVTSATRSPTLERAIAIARIAVEFSQDDTTLEIGQLDGRMKRLNAVVTSIPFIDPQRTRARA
ncbi:MAG: DUF1989 domain-containing protein [Pseudomonadota bacterium]